MIREYVRNRLNPAQLPAKKTSTPSAHDWRIEYASAKLSILEQSIQDALRFLKKQHQRWFYRHKLPWILVLGSENAGKTSLLSMSDLQLVSTNNQPLKLPHTTAYCDWLFSKDAVFIDVCGSLMLPDDPKNDSHLVWKKFIELLNRYRYRHRAVDSLIICIDFHHFLGKKRGQRQLQIDILRHRIQSLTRYVKALPVYLILTKCDRIAGFTDTFNTLSPEDCRQPFGISLPLGMTQQNLGAHLELQFDLFLNRLNEQLISRLHHEHSLDKRARIKDFPLQLEAQKRDIITLGTQLHSTRTSLGGIYFTSSLQDGISSDGLSPLLYTFGLPALPSTDAQPQKKPFFIHQALTKIIQNKIIPVKKLPGYLNWQNKHFYLGWGISLVIACLLLIPGYFYNQHTVARAREIMALYQPPANANNAEAFLPSLNILRRAVDDAKGHTNPLLTLVFHQVRTVRNNLESTYAAALNTQFAPLLKQTLEQQLQASEHIKPEEYFDALKTYLMLEDNAHLDTDFVKIWFNHYWQQQIRNSNQRNQLNAHLAFWLQQKPLKFATDNQIVQLAQQRLNSLPLAELTYLALQESFKTESKTASASSKLKLPIAPENMPLYLAKNFQKVYEDKIPELVQQTATGDNWVLNLTLPANLTDTLTSQLIISVRHLYVQRYADFWLGELLNIQPGQFANLTDARDFAQKLTTADSPLQPLFATVTDNLKPVIGFPEAANTLAALAQLKSLTTGSDQNANLQKALANLVTYLNTILAAKDSGEAALNAAKHRMRNNGKNDPISELYTTANSVPAPFNTWLSVLAQNTWRSILQTAANHINLLWLTEVIPAYNEHIHNRYPVFKDAEDEMSLAEFAAFFGPSGTIDTFTKQYLSAFIDNNQLYWQWKHVDGQTLPIAQKSLETMDRAALIQRMYFGNNQKTLAMNFYVMPIDSALMATNYVLTLDGQTVNYLHDFHQNKKFAWPAGGKQATASFALMDNTRKTVFFEETGPWSLFKLLAQGHLTSSHNTQLYQLLFHVGGTAVTYQLFADRTFNPFILHILDAFRCPEKL